MEQVTEQADDRGSRFEDDLRALEQIVDDLERGDDALAAALARYEQGVKLLVRCQAALEAAERSVALLTGVNPDGTPVTAPFDAAATAPTLGTSAPAPAPTAPTSAPRRRSPRPRPSSDSDDASIPF